MRADRLDVSSPELYIYAETNLELIHQTIEDISPDFVVVDSIQTVLSSRGNISTWECFTGTGMYC